MTMTDTQAQDAAYYLAVKLCQVGYWYHQGQVPPDMLNHYLQNTSYTVWKLAFIFLREKDLAHFGSKGIRLSADGRNMGRIYYPGINN
jgi:hypothetical protein